MTAPRVGDRIVIGDGDRWAQYRYRMDGSRTNPRYHASRKAAIRQARRLAAEAGVRAFVLEQSPEGAEFYRLVKRATRSRGQVIL